MYGITVGFVCYLFISFPFCLIYDGVFPVGRMQRVSFSDLYVTYFKTQKSSLIFIKFVQLLLFTSNGMKISFFLILIIPAMPTITYRPKDVAIDQHGEGIFVCEAEGNPPPLIFWSLEGNRTLIFPGEKHGKFRAGANKDGQTILSVQVRLHFNSLKKIHTVKRIRVQKRYICIYTVYILSFFRDRQLF